MQPDIDVVIPVYNEAAGIEAHMEAILRALAPLRKETAVRFILVDDGSNDATFAVIEGLRARHSCITAMRFTRNFGKEAAIEAGLAYSEGRAVVVMDSDLQHPPELVLRFVEEWRRGALVVETIKRSRGREGRLSASMARLFYWLFDRMTQLRIHNHTDFKLLDRRVVDLYLRLPERGKFFRALVQWLGYAAVKIPFDVPERGVGQSAWSRFRLLRYAWNNICSFSGVPLYLFGLCGLVAMVVAMFFLGVSLVQYFRGTAATGFTTVIFLIVFLSGVQLLGFGVLGGFVMRVYDEIKRRPSFLIERTQGFDKDRMPNSAAYNATNANSHREWFSVERREDPEDHDAKLVVVGSRDA